MTKSKNNYGVAPTPQLPEQDYFYYVTDEDKKEVLEVLGYSARSSSKSLEDERVSKYY